VGPVTASLWTTRANGRSSRPSAWAKMVRGVETRPFRSSVFCYTEGLRLCRDFAGHNPARFKRLLTEQLALSDLI
jgi:hypothetical protein